jgi:RimJ/RimL family protein N-acetyltransferase
VYNPYAVGRRVYLRHPTMEDVEGKWHEWFSDEDTSLWLPMQYWPSSVERQREYYQASLKSTDRLTLSVVDIETERHIGVCSFAINWLHRHTEISFVIGEKAYRTGPFALETLSLMFRIAFLRLNMRMIRSSYVAANASSKGIVDVLRFEEVGRIKGMWWVRGEYVDGIYVVIYREDWLQRNPSAVVNA